MFDPAISAEAIAQHLRHDGYVFVPGAATRTLLGESGDLADWNEFAASWNDLAPDSYLAERGLFRRRRFAVFRIDAAREAVREQHQPHYQAVEYNPLQGGIARWFAPIAERIADSGSMRRILRWAVDTFQAQRSTSGAWRVEVHQFRIEAGSGREGQPTPEGIHRDGVDYVLVLMIRRSNIASGTTTVHTPDGAPLGAFTLTHALDAALLDDARVHHGVTPVQALDPTIPAYRDVLVVTLRAIDSAA